MTTGLSTCPRQPSELLDNLLSNNFPFRWVKFNTILTLLNSPKNLGGRGVKTKLPSKIFLKTPPPYPACVLPQGGSYSPHQNRVLACISLNIGPSTKIVVFKINLHQIFNTMIFEPGGRSCSRTTGRGFLINA